jgi:hypothetical protein
VVHSDYYSSAGTRHSGLERTGQHANEGQQVVGGGWELKMRLKERKVLEVHAEGDTLMDSARAKVNVPKEAGGTEPHFQALWLGHLSRKLALGPWLWLWSRSEGSPVRLLLSSTGGGESIWRSSKSEM